MKKGIFGKIMKNGAFLFLRHVLNRCSFRDNCVWICYKLFVVIHKLVWIVYYNEELVTNSKFQTQLSRKLQRFRTCRKNKKCSIFHDLSEYIIFSYGCNWLDWSFNVSVTLRGTPCIPYFICEKLEFKRICYFLHNCLFLFSSL